MVSSERRQGREDYEYILGNAGGSKNMSIVNQFNRLDGVVAFCLEKHIYLLKILCWVFWGFLFQWMCSSLSFFLIISSRFPVELIWIKSCRRNRLQKPPLAALNFPRLAKFSFSGDQPECILCLNPEVQQQISTHLRRGTLFLRADIRANIDGSPVTQQKRTLCGSQVSLPEEYCSIVIRAMGIRKRCFAIPPNSRNELPTT